MCGRWTGDVSRETPATAHPTTSEIPRLRLGMTGVRPNCGTAIVGAPLRVVEHPIHVRGDRPEGSRERSVKEYEVAAGEGASDYEVTAILHYRKVDQFLLNYMFGEDAGLSAPVAELSRATVKVSIVPAAAKDPPEEREASSAVGG